MRKIYEPEHLMEGELLQSMLASEGIESHITGRHLLGGAETCRLNPARSRGGSGSV